MKRPNSPNLSIETLERRDLMAADADLANGILSVTGTDNPDYIRVSQENNLITVTIRNAVTFAFVKEETFKSTLVNEIRAEGFRGSDIILNFTDKPSVMYGGSGGDLLQGSNTAADVLYSGYESGGNDDGYNRLIGRGGEDTLMGGSAQDEIDGDAGIDYIYGAGGRDTIRGGTEDDYIFGEDGDDVLYGGAGNDYLYGGDGLDWLYGEANNDHLYGEADIDWMYGGADDDYLYGGGDNDFLYGEAGVDVLRGEGGHDDLHGGDNLDILIGGAGNDILAGGADADYMYGDAFPGDPDVGDGNDQFIFETQDRVDGWFGWYRAATTWGLGHVHEGPYDGHLILWD